MLCLIIHILESFSFHDRRAAEGTALALAAWPSTSYPPLILITLVCVCRVAWKSQGHFLLKTPLHLLFRGTCSKLTYVASEVLQLV